jgi:hypothetical protein
MLDAELRKLVVDFGLTNASEMTTAAKDRREATAAPTARLEGLMSGPLLEGWLSTVGRCSRGEEGIGLFCMQLPQGRTVPLPLVGGGTAFRRASGEWVRIFARHHALRSFSRPPCTLIRAKMRPILAALLRQ